MRSPTIRARSSGRSSRRVWGRDDGSIWASASGGSCRPAPTARINSSQISWRCRKPRLRQRRSRRDQSMSIRDLIIIGAGPSGLSAAIAAKQRGLDYQVLEQGVLVDSIYRFPPQMVFFTTPELLEIGGLPFVSPFDKPTKPEALRYYRKVADTYDLQIAFDETVLAVERESGEQVFGVSTKSGKGVRRVRHARNVVFAIGYFDHPNLIGVPGEDLPHVHHYYGDPHQHYRQRVVIVGGGNSAAEWALQLYRSGVHVTLVHRRAALQPTIEYWVRPEIEDRI